MKALLITGVAAALGSAFAVPLVKRLAFAVGAIDQPTGGRRIHKVPIPRLGGLAVFGPALVVAVLALHFLSLGDLRLTVMERLQLLLATGAVLLLGIYDDIRGASPALKLAVQVGAAGALYYTGISVEQISTPFGLTGTLGILDLPLTILWVVGLTNAVNLLDGIDGVAAGVGALGAFSIAILSVWQGSYELALIAACICGSLIGFLFFNFHPASIFLGDCGALTLGFLLAEIPLLGSQKAAAAIALLVPIIALGIPIFDTVLAIIRRKVRGRRLFQADRAHLHHRMLALGLTQTQVAITLYVVSGVLSAMAILMTIASSIGGLLILLVLAAGGVVAVRRLGMDEVKASLRIIRHGERRRRPPKFRSLLVQNSVVLIEQCRTRKELADLLDEVRRGLDCESLRIRFKDGLAPTLLGGSSELVFTNSDSPLESGHGKPDSQQTKSVSADIYCEAQTAERGIRNGECGRKGECCIGNEECGKGNGRVVGQVISCKRIWDRRRISEKDDELLQTLAEGLGRWFAKQLLGGNVARSRVLVVDQDKAIRRLVQGTLQEGCDVITAADGMGAMAEAHSQSPDLILFDPKEDRVNGISVFNALKADPRMKDTPIIIIAAKDAAKAFQDSGNGADSYLMKPFSPEDLKDQIRKALPEPNSDPTPKRGKH